MTLGPSLRALKNCEVHVQILESQLQAADALAEAVRKHQHRQLGVTCDICHALAAYEKARGGEVTFSDDDLKRLKERLADKTHDSHEDYFPIMHEHFTALIARLEAAEHWALDCPHDVDILECACEEAWRKAAGKSEKENP